ncbi:NADH-quinone oxidoreductase subunit H [bacterium]|nr:NADH-quinone oxidoreductase subunit H [bacterium]
MNSMLILTLHSTINTGFLTIPDPNYQILLSHAISLFILLFLSFQIISAVTANNFTPAKSDRHLVAKLLSPVKSLLHHFLNRRRNLTKFNIRKEFLSFNLLYSLMSLINICALILFPISQQYSGVQLDYSCMIVILCLLLNLIVYATGVSYSNKNTTAVVLRNSRLIFTVLIVIIVASLSVSGSLHSFRISSIVKIQQDRFLFTLPAWNILRNPLLFLNAILFFVYTVLLAQLLNQTEQPVPFKIPCHPLKTADTFSYRVVEFWKFSFLVLITFYYIFLFWGAYSSPFYGGSSVISNITAIAWLLMKICTFLILIRFVYRSIPHLIEEQILQLTYTFIFPIQIISLVLGLIFLHN